MTNTAYKIIGLIVVVAMALFAGAFFYISSLNPTAMPPTTNTPGDSSTGNVPVTPVPGGNNSGGSTGGSGENTSTAIPDQTNPDTGATAGPTVALPTASGSTVTAKDIKKDPATGKYPAPGYYYVGYHQPVDGVSDPTATENPPYLILYIDNTHYFNITLLTEPLADTRVTAEEYLQARLGLSESDMCQINYRLSVPNSVSQVYAGEDLRFSFCIDATSL